jgi:hypothetical protein
VAGKQKAKSGHKPNEAKKRTREAYKREGRLAKNKVKRIARSNGRDAAIAYARAHLLSDWATKRGII